MRGSPRAVTRQLAVVNDLWLPAVVGRLHVMMYLVCVCWLTVGGGGGAALTVVDIYLISKLSICAKL